MSPQQIELNWHNYKHFKHGMVIHAFNPSVRAEESDRSL